MGMETWTWRHGHGDMGMDTWAWRHGHGWISDGMHMHMHMRMQLHTCTACTLSMCKCTGTDCCTRMGHTHGMSRRSRPSTRESPARTHWCSESAACGPALDQACGRSQMQRSEPHRQSDKQTPPSLRTLTSGPMPMAHAHRRAEITPTNADNPFVAFISAWLILWPCIKRSFALSHATAPTRPPE